MNANIASKCAECRRLKIMDATFGGGRYVCFRRDSTHRAFLTYGRPIGQGVPLVQRCKSFEYGKSKRESEMNLKFSMQGAFMAGEDRHPQIVMRELGVQYVRGIPQSIGDQWWFIGCTSIPEPMPPFLAPMEDQSPDIVA